MDFTLYTYFRSSTAYRTRIALNYKNIAYTQCAVHLLEGGGQQFHPEYIKLNPAAEVPTLIHQGRPISQSFAIIEYLEDIVPLPPLFPSNHYDRARVRQICEHINCGIHPIVNLKVQQYLERALSLNENQKSQWIQHWLHKGMGALESLLTETSGQHAYGDQLTVADVFVVPQVFSSKRFGVTLSEYPTIQKVYDAAMKISAFNQAHPHVQPDTPSELYGKV